MAISLVQTLTKGTAGGVGSTNAAWGGDTTTGNTVIVGIDVATTTANWVSTVTDTQGNTYNRIFSAPASSLIETELWYAYNITGGTTPTITVTMTSNTFGHNWIAREYSGLTTTDPLDVHNQGAIGVSSPMVAATTATTNQADELVIGAIGAANGNQSGAGTGYGNYVKLATFVRALAMVDKIISSTGTQAASVTVSPSDSGSGGTATFKASSSVADDAITTSDTVTTSESMSSYSDQVFTRESINVSIQDPGGDRNIAVSDTLTTSESVTRLLTSNVTVTDNSTLSESLLLVLISNINKSDTATLSESVQLQLLAFISASDTLTLSENRILLVPTLFVTTSDTITTSESTLVNTDGTGIAVLDNLALSESVQMGGVPNPSVNDSLNLSESTQLIITSFVNKSDTATLSESTIALITPLFINVTDTMTVTEQISLLTIFLVLISVSDNMSISEGLSVNSNFPPPIPYRLLNPAHVRTGPRGTRGSRIRLGPRFPTRGPR